MDDCKPMSVFMPYTLLLFAIKPYSDKNTTVDTKCIITPI
jgi:hypothetical protein